ncbi:hypothetical protein [Mesorhizobium sp.]|nr:hypothetical protein [Mesorhizobium sp.]
MDRVAAHFSQVGYKHTLPKVYIAERGLIEREKLTLERANRAS